MALEVRKHYDRMTPHEAAASLRDFAKNIPLHVLIPSLEEAVPAIKRRIQDAIETSGLAQGLRGQRASKVSLTGARSRQAREKASSKVYVACYKRGAYAAAPAIIASVWGLAALIEQGGRIRRHMIPLNLGQLAQARRAQYSGKRALGPLKAQGLTRLKGAGFAHPITVGGVRGALQHPGAPVRAHEYAYAELARSLDGIKNAIERRLTQTIVLTGLR